MTKTCHHFGKQKRYVLSTETLKTSCLLFQKETIQFNEHYQSYEVDTPSIGQLKIVYSKDFTCYVPLNQIKIIELRARSKFVCLPYEIEMPN